MIPIIEPACVLSRVFALTCAQLVSSPSLVRDRVHMQLAQLSSVVQRAQVKLCAVSLCVARSSVGRRSHVRAVCSFSLVRHSHTHARSYVSTPLAQCAGHTRARAARLSMSRAHTQSVSHTRTDRLSQQALTSVHPVRVQFLSATTCLAHPHPSTHARTLKPPLTSRLSSCIASAHITGEIVGQRDRQICEAGELACDAAPLA